MPEIKNIKIDRALTNLSIKYTNDEYVATRVLPEIPVTSRSGKLYKYDNSHLRPENDEAAPGAGTREAEYGMAAKGSYQTSKYKLKDIVPDEEQDEADSPLDPRIDTTEALTDKRLVNKEKDLADFMTNTSNLTNNTTLSGTDQWSDYPNSDPIGDVRTAADSVHSNIFKEPNTLLFSKKVYRKLLDHPDIIDRVKYSQFGATTKEILARLFDVEEVIVAGAGYNSANGGQSDSLSYIWGKDAILFYKNPNPGKKKVSFGYYYTYKNRLVDRWYDKDREGTFIRVKEDYTKGIVTADAGYLIKNAVN